VLADEGLHGLSALGTRRRSAVAVSLCALAVAVGLWAHVDLARVRGHYERGLRRAHVALGSWLAERYPDDALVALGDAGAIPFYSGLRIIDLWGLADAKIAALPGEYGSRPGTADYALGRNPDVVVLWSFAPILKDPAEPRIVGAQHFDREIARHPSFQRNYRFAREFTFRPEGRRLPGYYLDVFERRPSPGAQP